MLIYITAILSLVWYYYTFLFKRPIARIPGPKGFPFFGNAFQLDPNRAQLHVDEWSKKYGDVYQLNLKGQSVVVVSGKDELYEVLVRKGAEFAGRPDVFRFHFSTSGYTDIQLTDMSPELKWKRKFVHGYMRQYGRGMKRIEDVTESIAGDIINELYEKEGKPVDIHYMIYKGMINIIYVMVKGDRATNEQIKLMQMLTEGLSETISFAGWGVYLDMFPWLRYIHNQTYNTLAMFKREVKKLAKEWMDDAKDSPYDGFAKHFLTLPEDEKEEFKIDYLTYETQAWQTVLTAGFTSSSTLTSLIAALVHHPDVQKKLQKEVQQVVGSSRPVTLDDKKNMPIHQAAIYEVSRFMSMVPLAIPHKALTTTTVGKYTIPEGTTVWCNLWGLHHDERYWKDPYKFDIQRYLDDDDKLLLADHPNRVNTMPFGAGNRVCVGEIFALTRIFLILATLMQHFTILPKTTIAEQPGCDPRTNKPAFIMQPNPFNVVVQSLK